MHRNSRRELLACRCSGRARFCKTRKADHRHASRGLDFDPKFPFHHPERPDLKRSPMEAPIENEVAEMREFGLKYAVLINPRYLRLGQLVHQLLPAQVSEAVRGARTARSGRARTRRTASLLG